MKVLFKMGLLFLFCNIFACKNIRSRVAITDSFAIHVVLKKKTPPPETNWDDGLRMIENEFVQDASRYGVVIYESTRSKLRTLQYVDNLSEAIGEGVVASCNRYYSVSEKIVNFQKVRKEEKWLAIEVLRSGFDAYVEGLEAEQAKMKLKELLYHELFHCYLDKAHLPMHVDGIMNPVLKKDNSRAYTEWELLVEELFSPTNMKMIDSVNKN